jgi:hypothetical protein
MGFTLFFRLNPFSIDHDVFVIACPADSQRGFVLISVEIRK